MTRKLTLALAAGCVLALPADAQVIREIVDNPLEKVDAVAIDDAGTVVYAISTTNQFGTNPDHRKQIVRWDPATGIGSQVTNFEEGADTISVSDDGAWLAFVSSADPLSTNHDESAEVFVMQPDGTGLAQLTSGSFLPHEQRGIRAAVISGSGNRVAFVGRVNPLGTNPTYLLALFVIDRDGANLRQLATDVEIAVEHPSSGDKDRSSLDISDDGSKVVFMKAGQIWGINANGTASHTFTSTTGADEVSIAGNGGRIVYAFDGLNPSLRTRTFDGNPGTIVTILGERPLLTDDSTLVYFYGSAAPAGIWKVSATGGAATSVAPGLRPVRMSGNGARLTARGSELVALDNTGGSLQQLSVTSLLGDDLYDPSLTSDGNKLRFFSTFDPLGTNPGHQIEMFEYSFASNVLTQLTDASVPTFLAEFVSDGGVAVFDAGADLTGQNPCGRSQVFRWDPVGGVVQLTICHPQSINSDPKITADGQHVLYYDNEFNSGGLYIMNADGTGRMPVPMVPSGMENCYGIGDGDPLWIAVSSGNQIFRIKGDGTGLQQVSPNGHCPSISVDGNRLAWQSSGNLTGQNADGSFEIFSIDVPTGAVHQLTSSVDEVGYTAGSARITPDGQWVFAGDRRCFADTGAAEPATGFHHTIPWANTGDDDLLAHLGATDATGSRWIMVGADIVDQSRSNPSWFVADVNEPPAIVVGKASPTVLSWDPSPGSFRYDVIRGSLSSLADGGATVDLGPVSCVEDDSPDNHTRGHEDPAVPALGQGFFYLYRGSVGIDATAGSYGQGTGGKERVAGAGACAP